MKISLISLLTTTLLIGCSGAATTSVAPPPVAAAPTLPALPPAPAPPPVVVPVEEHAAPEMTADGRVRVKGDGWELDVPGESHWQPKHSEYEWVMVNPELKMLFILDREGWNGTLAAFTKKLTKDAKAAGGVIKQQRNVKLEKRSFGFVEVEVGTTTVGIWLLKGATQVYSVTCGGADFTKNKSVCEDLTNTLQIDVPAN